MAGKALKASGKRVMKYSRDGAVARDLAESSETRISGRTEDAVLKVEHTDERFNAHGTVPEQTETEQKHRRHTPSDVQEQPQNTENGQSNSGLKFEYKTFKFDDTDIPAPPVNETVPVEAPAAAETPAVPDNSEQQPETPQSIVAAQVVADHSDDTDEIPQDSFIIENLFAEFYGSDDAPASGSKSDKFSFRQDEQSAPNTGKKRKAGRLQEDMHGDSKLKEETSSTSLKQDAAKSGLMFGSAVKSAESIEGETAEMTDGESGSKLSHKRRDEPDEDEALAEESENADTLKFEHIDRDLEKQSHFADKLSTGSSASKKLSESKLPREKISEEEQARQDVRKRQRKAQQAEQAKKKAETTVDDKVSENKDKNQRDYQHYNQEYRTCQRVNHTGNDLFCELGSFLNNALCCFSRFLSLFALLLTLSLSCSVTGFLFRLCFLELELRTAGIGFLYSTVPLKAQSFGLAVYSLLFAVIYPGDRIFGEPQSRFSDLFGLVGSFQGGVILLILRDLTVNAALDSAGYSCCNALCASL